MNNLAINPAVNFGRRNPQTENTDSPEKSSNKNRNLKIAAAAVGTAAVLTAGIVYRKNIAEFLKSGFKNTIKIFISDFIVLSFRNRQSDGQQDLMV